MMEDEEHNNGTVALPPSSPSAETSPSAQPSSPAAAAQEGTAPAEGLSKRQRRPNVRLNEIGTNVLEYLLKHKGGRGPVSSNKPQNALRRQLSVKQNSEDRLATSRPSGNHFDKKKILASNGASQKAKLAHNNRHAHDDNLGVPHHGTKPHEEANSWRSAPHRETEVGVEHATHTAHDVEDWMEERVRMVQDDSLVNLKGDNHAGSSFRNDSPEGFKEASMPKRRKKKNSKMGSPLKGRHTRVAKEEEQPSSSGVQELRQQVPLWERGIAPLDEKVRDWLQNLGLHKYSFLFQRHEVGDDVLPLLTMDDLKEIGITAVGARRKIFSEITKLRKEKGLVSEDMCSIG